MTAGRPGDAAAIAELSASAQKRGKLVRRSEAEIAEQIDSFLVARVADRVVGATGTRAAGADLLLFHFCVAESSAGAGVGSSLVAAATRQTARCDLDHVIAFSLHGGDWFAARGFERLEASEISPERARLRTPGRRSPLYVLDVRAVPTVAEWDVDDHPRHAP